MQQLDHSTRIDWSEFETLAPGVPDALRALSAAIAAAGLDPSLNELVKIRASQINGCTFCLQFHLNIARKLGIEQVKLDQLAAWREANVYSARERAALGWTEALTRMPQQSIDPAVFVALETVFSRQEIALLTGAIGTIQAWNRIAGALAFTPPAPGGAGK
jgi:AhpD family alkylhydroperoxidase